MSASPLRGLVTGATGFIGSHLVRHLAATGWNVNVLVRPTSDSAKAGILLDPVVRSHVYDGSVQSLVSAVQAARPAVVFHLASLFLVQHGPDDTSRLVEANLLLGTQLAEAMAQAGVRKLVNTGTAWQHYGGTGEYSPVNLYAATKQAFEDLLQYYVEAAGFQVVTLKLADTYGPQDPRPKLFNLLREAAITGDLLTLSPGGQLIDLVYIEDVVEAFRMAADLLLRGEIHGHARYGVGSGLPLPLHDLVRLFEQLTGCCLNIAWGGRPYRPREVMVPCQGTPVPGWRPRTPLKEGIQRIANEATKKGPIRAAVFQP